MRVKMMFWYFTTHSSVLEAELSKASKTSAVVLSTAISFSFEEVTDFFAPRL